MLLHQHYELQLKALQHSSCILYNAAGIEPYGGQAIPNETNDGGAAAFPGEEGS